MLRIAHLSDIHLSAESLNDLKRHLLPALVNDLLRFNKEKSVDVVCVTGDLIDKAGKSFDGGAEEAFASFKREILDVIRDALNISEDRIHFTLGNHDICRSLDEEYTEVGIKSCLVDVEKVNSFIRENKSTGVKRVSPYKKFEQDYRKNFDGEKKITGFESTYKFSVDGLNVGLVCLNSSWRCWDSKTDVGSILVGEEQVLSSVDDVTSEDLKICLMHHSPDALARFDKKAIEPFMLRNFDLLLCGHIHEGDSYSKSNLYGGMAVSIAPSNWNYNLRTDSREKANGYTIVDVAKESGKGCLHARRYSHKKGCFDPNTDLGDERGIQEFFYPTGAKLSKVDNEYAAVATIKDFWYEELDECLLSYSTETKAPKKIEDIFVLPTIVEKVFSTDENDDDEREVGLDELCRCTTNKIIFGQKEVGKTTLLNKLIIELSENIPAYHKIPVYIDFRDIGNSAIETFIAKYLHVKVTEKEDYIKNNNIFLLLDNLSFDNEYVHQIRRLEAFMEAYEDVIVVATSSQIIEGRIPMELFEHDKFIEFNFLHIKTYKTREIKALINNWFSNNPDIVKDGKLDKLIGVFGALNLPRTPLAISMFLWIFEQQENYKPINHATMLENFIERMFSKTSKQEALSEKFDYRNKERLLSDIAHEMLLQNNENYRLPYTDLVKFVEEKFKAKKFEKLFSPTKIIDHFLEKGLMVEEYFDDTQCIRFRFSCFFQYFITKKMEFDTEFRDYVLADDNFLHFTNEIDYYTGLKRDQGAVLKILVERMAEAYSETIEKIKGFDLGFDDIFNHAPSIAASLDENFVEELKANGKPSEQEIDKVKDEMLDKVKPDKTIENKQSQLRPLQKMERLWTVSAKALKNSEEVEEAGLKEYSYKNILECSMAFSNVYKFVLEKYLHDNQDSLPANAGQELMIRRNIIPFINQIATYMLMGTSKLNVVIKEKIEQDSKNEEISDYEKFMSVFLYADLRGTDYMRFVERFIKGIKRPYILDMAFFKVVGYYFFRSNAELDNQLENMIADILIKSKKSDKDAKNQIKIRYKKRKKEKEGEVNPFML